MKEQAETRLILGLVGQFAYCSGNQQQWSKYCFMGQERVSFPTVSSGLGHSCSIPGRRDSLGLAEVFSQSKVIH